MNGGRIVAFLGCAVYLYLYLPDCQFASLPDLPNGGMQIQCV